MQNQSFFQNLTSEVILNGREKAPFVENADTDVHGLWERFSPTFIGINILYTASQEWTTIPFKLICYTIKRGDLVVPN